jgi:Thiopeptide-type bacteriocin precursor
LEKSLAYDLDSLAVDVFELVDTGMTVESLTGGHGMTELAASSHCYCSCWQQSSADAPVPPILCSGSCPCSAFSQLTGDELDG